MFQDVSIDAEEQAANGARQHEDTIIAGVQPILKDAQQEKAEKKRLEKEQKERIKLDKEQEKKRKEEEKRQLKEQEKKLKDAAKMEKEGDKPRKAQRDDRNKSGGISAFFSPLRPGVRSKDVVRGRVLLLDGSEVEVEIEVISQNSTHRNQQKFTSQAQPPRGGATA